MSLGNLKGIVELGNIDIKCVIFRIKDNNDAEILSTSVIESEGIHNGDIVNLTEASKAIRSCIGNAEKKIQASLKKLMLSLNNLNFCVLNFLNIEKLMVQKFIKKILNFY